MDRKINLEKHPIKQFEKKNSKNKSQITACKQNHKRQQTFVQTPFLTPHYFEFRVKIFYAANSLALFTLLPVSA